MSDSQYSGTPATFYYLPGATGWGSTWAGRPTSLWNPTIDTSGSTFGVGPNGFGFTISGSTNIPIVVIASTNPASSDWVPMHACTLTNGSFYFSDPSWTNYPARLCSIRSP